MKYDATISILIDAADEEDAQQFLDDHVDCEYQLCDLKESDPC